MPTIVLLFKLNDFFVIIKNYTEEQSVSTLERDCLPYYAINKII